MKRLRKAFHNPALPDKRLKALASTISETSDDVSKPIGFETLKESVSKSGFAGQAPKGTCQYAFETSDEVSKAIGYETLKESVS